MLQTILQYILDMGAGVFLPIIMIFLGIIFRMPLRKNLSSALTLGVAFVGMNIVIGFMFNAISPAAQALVENTGKELSIVDLGWTPIATISWAWPYAFLMFPVQIVINLLMLGLGWTKTLNVDMWNVWNKILCAVLMVGITDSLAFAFFVSSLMVVFELKNADISQKKIQEVTQIPGVTMTHCMGLTAVIIAPINRLLDFVPGINKIDIDSDQAKEKLGIFGENHVLGFIVGFVIAMMGGYGLQAALILAVSSATALLLFPMISKLFMQALAPVADAAAEFMKSRFPGKEIYIGLDWPFLAGRPEVWVTMIILVPFTLMIALILPGNNTLPFGGIMAVCYAPVALYICKGNLVRMIVCGLITMPLYLWVGTYFAPIITDLAVAVGTIEIPDGQLITWNGIWAPEFLIMMAQVGNLFKGIIGPMLLIIPGYALLVIWYYRYMTKGTGLDTTESATLENA